MDIITLFIAVIGIIYIATLILFTITLPISFLLILISYRLKISQMKSDTTWNRGSSRFLKIYPSYCYNTLKISFYTIIAIFCSCATLELALQWHTYLTPLVILFFGFILTGYTFEAEVNNIEVFGVLGEHENMNVLFNLITARNSIKLSVSPLFCAYIDKMLSPNPIPVAYLFFVIIIITITVSPIDCLLSRVHLSNREMKKLSDVKDELKLIDHQEMITCFIHNLTFLIYQLGIIYCFFFLMRE